MLQVRAFIQLLPFQDPEMVITTWTYPPCVEADICQVVAAHAVHYLSEVGHEAQRLSFPFEEPQLHFVEFVHLSQYFIHYGCPLCGRERGDLLVEEVIENVFDIPVPTSTIMFMWRSGYLHNSLRPSTEGGRGRCTWL